MSVAPEIEKARTYPAGLRTNSERASGYGRSYAQGDAEIRFLRRVAGLSPNNPVYIIPPPRGQRKGKRDAAGAPHDTLPDAIRGKRRATWFSSLEKSPGVDNAPDTH